MAKMILIGHSHLDRLQNFRDINSHKDNIPYHVSFSRGGLRLDHLTGPIKSNWEHSKKLAYQQFNSCLAIEAKKNDSICFILGDNDVGRGKSAEEIATGLFAFGTQLKNRFSLRAVMFIQLFPRYEKARGNVPEYNSTAKAINHILKDLCKDSDNCCFVNAGFSFPGEDKNGGSVAYLSNKTYFGPDGVHLNSSGNQKFVKTFEKIFKMQDFFLNLE